MKNISNKFIYCIIFFCLHSVFASSIIIDDFNRESVNTFPATWEPQNKRGKELYKVCEENKNRFLTVEVKDDSVNIGKKFDWNLQKYPVLSWKWRIKKQPEGADQKKASTHDCAAAVYVLIKNSFSILPKYIKYIWSENLEPGTRFFFKKNRAVVVIRGNKGKLNEWFLEKRNVHEDYEYFYGNSKSKIIGISILSDANDTHTQSAADYDDIIISSLK